MIRAKDAILILLIASLVAGCGVRGPLEPPPGPHVYTKKSDPNDRKKDVHKGDDFAL
ncbi:MAG: lipoprotein, partial [Parvibaculaceae bacterium]